ncbi:2588_t:CDS:2 [Funneliformis geosporum]|uniref:4325_t:CDS:1 n=1 Tax=Funneliformis geosporum TaxID=1117311 RepID=A0A9W4SHA2_9GLOM|nr:4325_t:CDS:2 [Funneliformis geosporum]CAI2186655.1 2588_t:CDS:2 [Funneliformis geosporum]
MNSRQSIKELERYNNEITAKFEEVKQESMNFNESLVRRIQQLENDLSQVKHINQELMEENGRLNSIMQRNDSGSEKKHTEQVTNDTESIFPQDDTLSAELDRASLLNTIMPFSERVHKESDHAIIEKLQEKVRSLNDANKSMSLYIEKILNRIMEAQGFEEVLSSAPERKNPSAPNSAIPTTTRSLSLNHKQKQENNTKKFERRKSWSGSHECSNFQIKNSGRILNDKIIVEEPDQICYPLPGVRKSRGETITLGEAQKHIQRKSSASSAKNTKRFSIFNWVGSVTKEEKKEDPFMKPMILVQEKERKGSNYI